MTSRVWNHLSWFSGLFSFRKRRWWVVDLVYHRGSRRQLVCGHIFGGEVSSCGNISWRRCSPNSDIDRWFGVTSCVNWAWICWRTSNCIRDIWTAWNRSDFSGDTPDGAYTQWRKDISDNVAFSRAWCGRDCEAKILPSSQRRNRIAYTWKFSPEKFKLHMSLLTTSQIIEKELLQLNQKKT